MLFDVMIRNGRIVDGTGNPYFIADVGIKDSRIAAIGDLGCAPMPQHLIDADARLVVAPGFIDIHTHSDFNLLIDGLAQSKVRQGVTLELTNHCGGWAAPLDGLARDSAMRTLARYAPDFEVNWTDMRGYLDRLESQGASVNSAALVGHGAVRASAFGYEDRPPTEDELHRMLTLVEESMEVGCWGLSTGTYYAPGSYAATRELVECCQVVARYGGVHASHIRDESTYNIGLLASVSEMVEIGRLAGVRSEIAHIKCLGPGVWGRSGEVIKMLESARDSGIDITADQYPYTASGSSITGSLIPRWAQVGGRQALIERLRDPETRARLRSEIAVNYGHRGGPERLVVALYPDDPRLEGKSMADVAEIMGSDPVEAAMDLLEVADTSFVSHVLHEDDLKTFMQWGPTMIGSDGSSLATEGPLAVGWPHPRNFGTFPRVLARYVRDLGVLSLEDAIRKMTSLPAQRLGVRDRGLLREGFWADVTVFDPQTVQDKATFEQPLQYPTGIDYVLVNGELVIDAGEHTGRTPGQVLRRGS